MNEVVRKCSIRHVFLLCWKVGGLSPGVLIFLVPNGSLVTAGIPRPEPMLEPMPDPRGPKSRTYIKGRQDLKQTNRWGIQHEDDHFWIVFLGNKVVKIFSTRVHARKLGRQAADAPKGCAGVGIGQRWECFGWGLWVTESRAQWRRKALHVLGVWGGGTTEIQGTHGGQRVNLWKDQEKQQWREKH